MLWDVSQVLPVGLEATVKSSRYFCDSLITHLTLGSRGVYTGEMIWSCLDTSGHVWTALIPEEFFFFFFFISSFQMRLKRMFTFQGN